MKKIALVCTYEPDETLFYPLLSELIAKDFSVVVVNDGSGEKYEEIFKNVPSEVNVIGYEENHGKGHALKYGLNYIKNNYNSDSVIVTLDSDGQHKVDDGLKIAKIAENNPGKLILGSRKLSNKAPFKSRFGNFLAKVMFFLTTRLNLNDTQTGLRAFTYDLIDEFKDVKGNRYEYEMNVLLECSKLKIKIIEEFIEVIYINNNSTTHYNPLKDTARIFFELIKFSLSSLIGFLVDYGMFSLLILLPINASYHLVLANVLARVVSATVNFLINYFIVFRSKKKFGDALLEYACLALFILAFNTGILYLLVNECHIIEFLAKIIVETIMFILSWLVQRLFIFGGKKK